MHINLDKKFRQKFNELDQICKLIYPKYSNGFDAIRQFAYSLDGDNKQTLLNIIKARNMNIHDKNDIISFNREAIDFLQGLIDGANRKYYNGSKNKIDWNIENLRTKNLKSMGSKLNYTLKKYSFLTNDQIIKIKNELSNYIDLERKTSGLENVKKYYFEFLTAVRLIESKTEVKNARNAIRENNLRKAKAKAKNEIEKMFASIINDTSLFNLVLRNRAKNLKKSAIISINRCTNYNQLSDILEEYELEFDEIDS